MAELKQFRMPDVGEGLTEAEITRWAVTVGDAVEVNQVLVEVESAKAAVELPSPFAGVVRELNAAEGATVPVGEPIITIEVAAAAGAEPDQDLIPPPPTDSDAEAVAPGQPSVLVGYGPAPERRRRRRRATASAEDPAPSAHPAFDVTPGAGAATPAVAVGRAPLAKPPVRKLARELGVDLAAVPATGPNGTVSREDVQAAAGTGAGGAGGAGGEVGWARSAPLAGSGDETRVPVRGVRKQMAAAMVASAFTAPHVTEFVTVDVTETMALRDRVAARPEFAGVAVSPLLFVARAVLWALERTPIVNSHWDEPAGEIVVKRHVNLGIAAATDRGLVVPNVKDAHRLSLVELAHALASLTEAARAGRCTPRDLSGGTFSITNVGVFGVDTGTPIINPGESAILALGAVARRPWVVAAGAGAGASERIEPRWVVQLALSFDHRVIDGQQGSQFLADVAALLHDPALALL